MPVDSKVGRRHWGWLVLLVMFWKFQHFNLVSKIFQKLFKPLPCHKRIGKMLHAICISAVVVSLRWASCGPWASCFLCSDFSLLFSENALLSLLFSPKMFEVTKNCNFFPRSLEVCKNWINLIWAVTMLKFMKYFYFSFNSFFGTFILVFPYHGDIVLLFRENCFLILSFSKSENTQNIPTIRTFHDLNSYFCPSFSKFWALLYPYFFTGGHLKACRCVACKRNNSHFVRYVLISLDVQMPQVYLFSKLYVSFILQPIAFIFGRDEEDDQYKCRCILCKRELSLFLLCTYLPWRPRFTFWLTFLQSYISLLFLIGLLSYLVELKMRTSRRVVCKRDNSHFLGYVLTNVPPLTSEVYLLVNLFSKLYVTFTLQWITSIFGRHQ